MVPVMTHRPWAAALPGILIVLAGCGGGGGGSGQLATDVAATQAEYQIVDLATGAVASVSNLASVATDPSYRDRFLVVSRLPARQATLGQAPGTYGVQPDETPGQSAQTPCYIAVFEMTQGQWQRLTGSTPWTTLQPASLAGGSNPTLPACGISFDQAVAGLASARARGLDLRLPDDAQWESMARQGGGVFPWGDARDAATIRAAAVVAETLDGTDGPRPVGGRAAAPSGCYDVVGNVAEWSAAGNLRGGSWADTLSLARPANIREADPDIAYATAGLRVIFYPGNR